MPNKTKLTVVCREDGYETSILIYAVEVKDVHDRAEVQAAVQEARNDDLGDEANEMEILFAFAGDLAPIEDWRQ